jgi:pimeloyl-ACP methyl ester carboxylesterase
MRLAARHPDLVRSLSLLETSAEPEPAQNVPAYRKLAQVVRFVGPRPVAGRVMAIMFGQTFLTDPSRAVERVEWRRRLNSVDRVGPVRATRAGITDELAGIAAPTLVLVGDEDVATVPDKARRIQAGIAGSQLVIVPHAGHTSTIEQPTAVTAALEQHLART